jgi:hypothetical protein
MKFVVLLNERAGTLSGMEPPAAGERIARGFERAGASVRVR